MGIMRLIGLIAEVLVRGVTGMSLGCGNDPIVAIPLPNDLFAFV
jgi:hypothetical protein